VKVNKLKTLMNIINESKYMVVFTGAGISTSVGIKGFEFLKC
jgi:NAD-dependent SIR2 family protein deacetylase